ncbi:unnamed protein product [Zymoseptoria tritici ST99CH_3D1]|nr:unnamed protein product [Zymoseptoria tritici ST99CH_3D1]
MTTLLDLPEETIANILSLVSEDGPVPMVGSGDYPPHSASYSAYFNAALTCKDLYRIVQPELYKFVAFDGNPYRVGRDGSQGGHVDMHSFLRTLFEAPHLRRSIHEIHIKHCSSLGGLSQGPVPDEARLRMLLAQSGAGAELRDIILHALEWRCQAAYMAIVMLLAPKTRVLSMEGDDESFFRHHGHVVGTNCMQKIVRMVFRDLRAAMVQAQAQATGQVTPAPEMGMQNLQTCSLLDVTPMTLARIMSIPSLRTVKAGLLTADPGWQIDDADSVAGSSGVTTLHLSDTFEQPNWMKTLIAKCRTLKSLTYEVQSSLRVQNNQPVVGRGILREAIDGHQPSLQTLRIIDSTDRGQVFRLSDQAFGSLSTFSDLAYLEIDEQALFGCGPTSWDAMPFLRPKSQFFPPNLVSLQYHTYTSAEAIPDILDALSSLQDQQLNDLTVSCPMEDSYSWTHFGLNGEYFELLQNEPALDRGQMPGVGVRCGVKLWDGEFLYDRMELRFWDLQPLTYPNLKDTAERLRDRGVMSVIEYQLSLSQLGEEEFVFGDDLMGILGAKELMDKQEVEQEVESEFEATVSSQDLNEGLREKDGD